MVKILKVTFGTFQHSHLRSSTAGIITTPHVQLHRARWDLVGTARVVQVVDSNSTTCYVCVPSPSLDKETEDINSF